MKLGGNFLLSILGNCTETKRRQNYGQGSSWVGKSRFYSSRDEIFLYMLVFFNGVVVQNQKHNLQNSRFSLCEQK